MDDLFFWVSILVLVFMIKQSVSIWTPDYPTRNGLPCFNDCKKNKYTEYYSCNSIKIYGSEVSEGSSEYCSPSCGKTVKGILCDDDCEKRGENYYWCNVGKSWDYCSRNSCPIKPPPNEYRDCSANVIGKMVWLEYRYYPGYWLAQGYENYYAAVWKPNNHQDIYCSDEGYAWNVQKSEDGNGLYLKTAKPGYEELYFIGSHFYIYGKWKFDYDLKKGADVDYDRKSSYSNVLHMDISQNISKEMFSFRIICKDCSSMNDCILQRVFDESKVYANIGGKLRMCNDCGSAEWFQWRVISTPHDTFRCLSTRSVNVIVIVVLCSIVVLLCIDCAKFHCCLPWKTSKCKEMLDQFAN